MKLLLRLKLLLLVPLLTFCSPAGKSSDPDTLKVIMVLDMAGIGDHTGPDDGDLKAFFSHSISSFFDRLENLGSVVAISI